MKEYNIEQAIAAAEAEGMTGLVQPMPRVREIKIPQFDHLDQQALVRAEGEGMFQRSREMVLKPNQTAPVVR